MTDDVTCVPGPQCKMGQYNFLDGVGLGYTPCNERYRRVICGLCGSALRGALTFRARQLVEEQWFSDSFKKKVFLLNGHLISLP